MLGDTKCRIITEWFQGDGYVCYYPDRVQPWTVKGSAPRNNRGRDYATLQFCATEAEVREYIEKVRGEDAIA